MKVTLRTGGYALSHLLLIALIACTGNPVEKIAIDQGLPGLPATTRPVTSTPSPRPSATPSATPWPTLEPTALHMEILELLQTNANCVTPCIFGMVPGETSRSEIEGFLTYLDADYYRDVYLYFGPEGVSRPIIQLDFEFEEGEGQSIQTLEITFRVSGLDSSEYLSGFSPRTVLKNYGVPDLIGFHVGQGPWDTLSYQLFLYYKDEHALFEYNSKTLFASFMDGFQICPLDPGEFSNLWRLQLSENALEVPEHIRSASEITDLDKQDLVSLLLSGDSEDCFYLYPMRTAGN